MNLFQLMTDGVNLDALPTESENKREPIAFEPSPSGGFSVPSDLNAAFDAAASDFGIDADVLRAVAHTESRFNPDVVSGKVKSRTGAIGLMQFMPDTAKEYGINPVDPVESIFGAAAYLRKSLDKFDGDYGKAVASYNAGPNRKDFDAEDWDKRMPAETQDYLRKVFTAADKLKQGATAAPVPVQPAPDTGDETARLAARYKAPRLERTMGQAVSDTGAQLAEGVNNILGAVPNLIAPDSGAAQFFKGNADTAQNWQSDAIKQRTASAGAAIDKAGEDGVIAQMVEAAKQYSSDPALAARFVVTNLPSMIPGIGAAKLAQAAALARGATLAQAAATATTVAGGMNAALNAGGARGEAFDDLKASLMKQGVPEAKATEQALTGSLLPAAIGGVAGFISGKTGLEGAVVGKAGAKAAVTAGAKSIAAELGGEQLEEVAPKLATNYQASQFDNRSLGKDVGRTMVETAIGSGPGSIYSGVQAAANTRTAPTVESQPTTPTAPPVAPSAPDASQAVDNIASLIKRAEAQADGNTTQTAPVQPGQQAADMGTTNVDAGTADTQAGQAGAGAVDGAGQSEQAQALTQPSNFSATPTATIGTQTNVQAGPGFTGQGLAAEMAALKARSQPQATQQAAPAAPQPVTGGLAAEMSAIKSRNKATTVVDPTKPAPVGIGRNNTPLSEGGKPFKTKAEADTARKLQPMMRVKKEGKGFVLVEKTPAQIAAQEKAARRNLGSVGAGGGPLSAHAFLASQGGLSKSAMADLGFDKNVRVGSKYLFTNTGMTLEGMTEALQQNGYVQSTEQNPAIELVKRSANGQPQYTAVGWDQIARAEATARFEDHLAAQQEAAMADDEFDPFAPENLSGDFEGDDLAVAGYDAMQDPIKLEVNALLDKAEALGIDTDTIKETAYEDTKNEPEQAYFERVRAELTRAINASTGSRSNQEADGNAQSGQWPDAQRGSRADSREGDGREGAPGADSEGLTAYTPEEVTARQDATAQAEATAKRAEEAAARAEAAAKQASEIAQRSVAAADTFELGGNAEDNLSGQMGLKMSRRGGGQFADIARHFSQYPSRPPAGMPLEEARAFLKARRESMDALVDKYVPKAEGLMLPVQNGGFWGVTKEARPDGDEWRVTRFDKDMEPQGHEAHSSAEAAVADLMASVDPERLADGLMFSRKASGVSVGFKPGTKFLQATSDAGMVGGTVKDGVLRITFSEVDEAQRGQGNGLNLYQALIDQALDDGLKVTSDSTVEAEAVRVYEALGRRGYTVTRLDGGTTEDGAAYGVGATQPAFEVSRSDDVRRSFAGSSAATADRLSLMAAQDRLDAGENAEKVRQETGWHKGVDGRWRFEISDSDAKVDMKLLGNLARGGFDARPIEFVSYRREENGTYTLSLAPANPTRTSDFVSLSGVPESLLPSILPMDAQEAIQRGDGEEDYIGPALDDAKRVRAPFQFEGFNALPLEVVMNHPKLFAAYPALREIMVQVDSTLGNGATFAEMEYVDGTTGKVIKIGNPRAANVDNVLLHEIQHGIQSIEGFATGGTTQAFVEKQSAALPFDVVSGALEIRTFLDKYEKYGTTIDGLKDKPPKMLRDLLESSWALAKSRTTESIQKEYEFSMQAFDPKDSYRRLAGEVEARNTQARQGMSDAERRATPPSATADVADSNVIVVMNGKEMASAPLPANAPAPQAPRTPASTIRTAITKAYGNLLTRLEGKGLVSLTQTEEEAIAAAAQARADQNGGDVEAINQAMRASVLASQRAWHGTPHRGIEKFSTDKIGTGEGAQAFGWGLYFADRQELGEYYREKLTSPGGLPGVLQYNGQRLSQDQEWALDTVLRYFADSDFTKPSDISADILSAWADDYLDGGGREVVADAIRSLDASKFEFDDVGQLYEVEIPSDSNMLLWDRPLSEQPASVLKALTDNYADSWLGDLKGQTGKDLYQRIDRSHGGDMQAASQELAELGLKGIKYLDGQSRNKPLRDVKREFLAELPEDAGFDDVMELIGTGTFSDKNEAVLKALADLDWLGFDYPSQAISTALGNQLQNFDPSPELVQAVAATQDDSTYNYVVFSGDDVQIVDVKYSKDGNLEGFFDPATGKSFLIADNLTAESAPATLMHEVGIHMAADGKLEPLFTRAGNLLKLAKNDPFIQRVQSRMDESGETSNEEAAAYIVTEYEKDRTNAPQSVVSWVKDFIADVRAWLFSKGVLLKADQMTVADIAAVARANARGMANGVDEGQGNAYTGPDANNSPTAKDIERVERLSAVIAKGFGIEQPANESAYKAVSLPDAVALQSIGSAWGKRIIGFDLAAVLKGKSSDFSTVGGVSLSKVYDAIFISMDNDAPHLSVLGHELAHHMRLDEPQIYDDLVVAIRPFIKQEAYRQQFGKELVAAHLQDPDLIREEFIGEVLADGFMEPAFWNALGETSPSLLTRVVDAVVVLIDKARAAVGMQRKTEKYLTDFNRVMEIAGDAMARYAPDAATDIRRSVAGGGQQNLALNTPSPAWMLPQSTKTDALVYELQDQKVDLKRTQEAIKEAGRAITEPFDARMAETLMPGRVAYRTETFLKTEVAPLLEAMARNNVSQNELSDYLLARHAPERNTQIAKVNPEMPDGGAGTNSQGVLMTTQAAQDHIAALTAGKRTVLQLLANKIDAITANTRDMLVREGLEKQSTMDAWTGAYKHYVPLFKDEAVESPAHPIGSGLSVTGSASKRAMGSEGEVTNMVAHILMQRESAITRAEKNRVAMSLYGLALSNPNPQVWTTIRPNMSAAKIGQELAAMGVDPVEAEQGMQGVPTIRTINQVTGLVQDTPNPMYKRLENALVVKVDGEDRVVLFNATNPDALRMVRALKNQDGLTNFDLAGSMVGTATRYFASVNTQYNPAFGMVNVVRDIGGALVNLSTTDIADKKAKVLGDIPAAMKGIARDVRGDQQRTPWSDLWVQFQEDGGRTGYRDLFIDPFKRAEAVQKDLDAMQRDGSMSTGKVIHGVLDLLDDFNTTLENGVRLSAYKAALDNGMSRPAAAKMARELTVDFNRKGRTGRELGPLYAFFNASVQGTARTIESLKGPAGKKIIAGGLMLGVMQSLMLAAAGFDDDEPPEFVKARAFIIPMGDKKYIAIPLQFGLNALPNTGRVITDLMMTGGKDWQKKSFDALGEVMGSFNPLGGGNIFTAHGALTMVAPTVADPLIDLATNTNFAGAPIGRERSDWDTRPGDKLARESTKRSMTGQVYIGISKAVNAVSGGNEFKKGLASPTPEQVQYVFTTAGGGLYRELEKTLNIAGLKADGFEIKSRMIPLGGRFAGEVDDQDTQRSRYFKNVQRLGELDTELKGFEKADNDAEVMRIETERKDEADLLGDYKAISRDIAKLNKQAAENITDVEQLKELDAERLELMRELNDSVRKLEKRSTLFNQD